MIKVRLLKNKTDDYSQILDSATLPDIESLEELNVITFTAGKLLKSYAEALRNPNLVSVLLDKSVKNWTINDIESLQYELSREGFDLMITKESGEDLDFTAAQVKYIMIDSSTKYLTGIPYGIVEIVDKVKALDSFAVLGVLHNMLGEFKYFDPNKFLNNPINDLLNSLEESRRLVGTLNARSIMNLNSLLNRLNKKLYVISKS